MALSTLQAGIKLHRYCLQMKYIMSSTGFLPQSVMEDFSCPLFVSSLFYTLALPPGVYVYDKGTFFIQPCFFLHSYLSNRGVWVYIVYIMVNI